MGYCANTSPKALISADTASVSLTRWPQPSTVDLAKPWDGRHPPKRLMTYYLAFNQPMLRRLLEPKKYLFTMSLTVRLYDERHITSLSLIHVSVKSRNRGVPCTACGAGSIPAPAGWAGTTTTVGWGAGV